MKLSKIGPVAVAGLVLCGVFVARWQCERICGLHKIPDSLRRTKANADEATELYAKLMRKENDIFSSDNALWEKVFNAVKDSAMIEDGSNYGDFLLKTIDGAEDEFTADELKTLKAGAQQIKEIEDKLESLEKGSAVEARRARASTLRPLTTARANAGARGRRRSSPAYGQGPGWQRREQRQAVL